MDNFYVYIYLDQRKPGHWEFDGKIFKFEPFYVGKGRFNRDTMHLTKSSLKHTNLKNNRIKSIIREIDEQPIHMRVFENLTDDEAKLIEVKMITHFGRKDLGTGILTNMTPGGDGVILSEEKKKEISKTWQQKPAENKYGKGVQKYGDYFYCKLYIDKIRVSKSCGSLDQALECYDRLVLYMWGPDAIINKEENRQNYLQEDLEKFYIDFFILKKPMSIPDDKMRTFGVSFFQRSKKWRAILFKNTPYQIVLGSYQSPEEAAVIIDKFLIFFDLDCKINYPENIEQYLKENLEDLFKNLFSGKKKSFSKICEIITEMKSKNKQFKFKRNYDK